MRKIGKAILATIYGFLGLSIGIILLYANNNSFKSFLDTKVANMQNKNTVQHEAGDELIQRQVTDVTSDDTDYGKKEEDDSFNTEGDNGYDFQEKDAFEATYDEITDEDTKDELYVDDTDYHYSTDLYFNISDIYDEQTKEIMRRLNSAADELEKSGKQEPLNFGCISNPDVIYIPDYIWFNPEREYLFADSYEVKNMKIPYYVSKDWNYDGMGKNEWELVLNYFFDGMYTYLNVKEAKKFIDINSAFKVSEAGEDIGKHTIYTDACIAKIIALADTVKVSHPNAVAAEGTYALENVIQNGDMARATVHPVIIWYYNKAVSSPDETDPNKTYMYTYQTDERTGTLYTTYMDYKDLSFEVTMTKDDYGSWKVVCMEP